MGKIFFLFLLFTCVFTNASFAETIENCSDDTGNNSGCQEVSTYDSEYYQQSITNLCDKIGSPQNACSSGPNGEEICRDVEVGGDNCMGRCGLGCPGDGAPSCGNEYRFTQDCLNHDACVEYYQKYYHDPNRWSFSECNQPLFSTSDDCIGARICEKKWNGNGSLVSYSSGSLTGFGLTYDMSRIHPLREKPVVFFQWEVDSSDGKKLKIYTDSSSSSVNNATITYGPWHTRSYDKTYSNATLPFTIDPSADGFSTSDGDWFVIKVAFTTMVSSSVNVRVEAIQ